MNTLPLEYLSWPKIPSDTSTVVVTTRPPSVYYANFIANEVGSLVGISISDTRFIGKPRLGAIQDAMLETSNYRTEQIKMRDESQLLSSRWKKLVLDPAAGKKSKDPTRTTEPVFDALLRVGPAAIDLRDLPEDSVNGMHLAVVLRVTFSRRNQVTGWAKALQTAIKTLKSSGANVDLILAGLL